MAIRYTEWPLYIPNDRRQYQLFSFQGPPKFTQIRTFGSKTYHLAILVVTFLDHSKDLFSTLFRQNIDDMFAGKKLHGLLKTG
jgi:hypothetical protein